jgi:hypothetical protein
MRWYSLRGKKFASGWLCTVSPVHSWAVQIALPRLSRGEGGSEGPVGVLPRLIKSIKSLFHNPTRRRNLWSFLFDSVVDFFNHLNMLYGTVTEFCNPTRVSPRSHIEPGVFPPFASGWCLLVSAEYDSLDRTLMFNCTCLDGGRAFSAR